MTTSPSNDWEEAVGGSSAPEAVIGALLHLNRLRSQYIVGAALAQHFPLEKQWQQFQESQVLLETLTEFAEYVAALRTGNMPESSMTELLAALDREYPKALAAVEELAEYLEVAPQDLLSTLINR